MVALQLNNRLYTKDTAQNYWWLVFIPLGIVVAVFLVALGLEFRYAKDHSTDAGGLSNVLAAPFDWIGRGTVGVASTVAKTAASTGHAVFERAGAAVGGAGAGVVAP